MSLYHVFLDGAVDDSPSGIERLAAGMAEHYGLAAAELVARLARGRIRVKANVDRQVAEQYVRDLAALGGRCAIEEASARNSHPTPLAFPAVAPPAPAAAPPAKVAAPLPPSAPARPSGSILPPRTTAQPASASMASGLAAAFSGDAPAADLGALEQGVGALSLSSVDGADAEERVAPAAAALPASIGPAVPPAPAPAKPVKPSNAPVDLFAPPDADAADLKVDLADDPERDARRRASTPPPTAPLPRASQPRIETSPATVAPSRAALGDPRVRFVAGVVLAILIGFIPAHLIARARDRAVFHDIDAKVIAVQQHADDPDSYAALDAFRATQLDRKKSAHQTDALLGFLVWALVGGGIAYVWFRRIPWD